MKSLGNWLGKLTLSRNKPIIAKDLDFRDLLSNAYEKGKLNIIIPFTSKVLENSINSKVFTLKNPWLKAILNILNEICNIQGLRNNIIFEIKDLFKKLNINDGEFNNIHFFEGKILNKNSSDFNINNNQINQNNYIYNSNIQQENIKSFNKNNITIQDEQQLNLMKKELWNQILRNNYLFE